MLVQQTINPQLVLQSTLAAVFVAVACFAAFGDEGEAEVGAQRAEALKANVKDFRFELAYNGESDKPYYSLLLSVAELNLKKISSFALQVRISEEEALKLIDFLFESGSLDRAHNFGELEKIPEPCYLLGARSGDLHLVEILSWNREMLTELDALRKNLDGESAEAMDKLLGRMGGHRRQWEATAFRATARRTDTHVRFLTESDNTIFDINSKFGIDGAMISRQSDEWPRSVLIRLHLSGLESFTARNGEVAVEWSVSSTGDHPSRASLREGKNELALGEDSPYFTKVRMVGGNGKIPLKGGYFEVALPTKLLEGNPKEISLRWIDFYRN